MAIRVLNGTHLRRLCSSHHVISAHHPAHAWPSIGERRSLYFKSMNDQQSPYSSEKPTPETELPVFEVLLYPRRSLSPQGFAILIGATGIIGFAYGMAFFLMGAWPIFGFCGTEWLLFIYLFRRHLKGDKRRERLQVFRDRLVVESISAKGERRLYRFQPYWLQVILDEPDEYDSNLYLRSHGKQLRIGGFLSPQERRDVAAKLHAVLNQLRMA